jgi:hypothetical protein
MDSFRCAEAVEIRQTIAAKALNALIVFIINWSAAKPLTNILAV